MVTTFDNLPTSAALQQQTPWLSHPPAQLSASLLDWLQHQQSLTARLREQGAFRVLLQQAGQQRQLTSSHQPLVLGENCWQRDVVLLVDEAPWVLAWTLWPADDSAFCQQLLHLGERPLGDYLFVECQMQRVAMEYAAFSWLGRTYWARRSWLSNEQQQHCVVAEMFLAQMDWY